MSILDSDGVVTVEDGVDGLGDIGGEPSQLFPLLRLQVLSIEKVRPLRRVG